MDIRQFFNAEYSRLQIANDNIEKELTKTTEIIDSQIKEFERINYIFRGIAARQKGKSKKDDAVKEQSKLKGYQKKLVATFSKLVEPAKYTRVVAKEKSLPSKITSARFLIPSLTISSAQFNNVNFAGIKQERKSYQSSEDFYRTDDINNLYQEKIKILKRINANLSKSPNIQDGDNKEEKKEPGGFFGNAGNIISAMMGGSLVAKLLKKFIPFGLGKTGRLGRLGKVLTGKAAQKLGILGKGASAVGKKALPIVGAVFSIYDMVKAVKTGIAEYKKYSAEGDKLAASGAINSTLMNVFGNTINVVGSFLPGPLGIALFALGTSMTMVSDSMRAAKGRTSGYVGEAREKVAKTEQLIEKERGKGTLVELRTNFDDYTNIFWEYKNGDNWKPVIDKSTGKNLSAMAGKNPIIQATDPKLPGIQTYKLNTKTGIREIVVEGGNIYMIVPNVGKVAIATRKSGGAVVKNKPYLVGEHRAETYIPNKIGSVASKKIEAEKKNIRKTNKNQKKKLEDSFKKFLKDVTNLKNVLFAQNVVRSIGTSAPSDATATAIKKHNIIKTVGDNLPSDYTPQKSLISSFAITPKITEIVESKGRKLVLKSSDGTLIERIGNINWRANNPGNIRPTKHSLKWPGVVGSIDTINGKFLVFDSYDSGREALYRQLFEMPSYKNLTISEALQKYAPAADKNDPVAYAKSVIAVAGSDSVLSSFDETTRHKIIDAFQKKEGYVPGKEIIKSYSVGSWKIPEDQEAFVHKGEMIVPEYYAHKIRSEAKSGTMNIQQPEIAEEYDIYSDASFWINTFMPALANVVKMEYGGG
jgi:hypothetical protein